MAAKKTAEKADGEARSVRIEDAAENGYEGRLVDEAPNDSYTVAGVTGEAKKK